MTYINGNKRQEEMTAEPKKYPQGFFKDKNCRKCGDSFSPNAPSHMFCSTECADKGFMDRYLMRNYKITRDDYYNLLESQNHACAICAGEGFKMAGHHKLKLVVDHCHTTGKVRGLLCHNCNRALGLFKDNTASLATAISYLGDIND